MNVLRTFFMYLILIPHISAHDAAAKKFNKLCWPFNFISLIFIIFFPINSLFAFEVTCNFEEVYSNSEVQQGVFLIKDDMLRYQYYDQDLFTIIAKNNKYFLINNISKTVQRINEKTEALDINFEEYPG